MTSENPNSAPNWTNSATVAVNFQQPVFQGQQPTSVEYCVTQNPGSNPCQGVWGQPFVVPTQYTLTGGDGPNTVSGEYRAYLSGSWHYSAISQVTITLDDTVLSVTVNSPTSLPGAVSNGAQLTLSTDAQYVTGSIALSNSPPANDTVTVTLYPCNPSNQPPCSTTALATANPTAALPGWIADAGSIPLGTTYISAVVTNLAGSSATSPAPSGVFSVFTPSGQTPPLTCAPSTVGNNVECPTLAGQSPTMPNDSPDAIGRGTQVIAFSGYADPSIRRDPVVSASNPYGTNLWMLYSYPRINENSDGSYTGVVEIHLASSSTSAGTNGGASWIAQSPAAIWPSVFNTVSNTWSSHEVSNFWPYNGNWYAVHVMYFVAPHSNIANSVSDGCLVGTVAQGSPANLGTGWANYNQGTCTGSGINLPSNSKAITYATLTQLSGNPNCYTWGEPAIMINGGVAYLAASCFDPTLQGLGYYIFKNTDLTLGSWLLTSGPFTFTDLPNASSFPKATFLTEFDWAQRPDGTIVAVVTPDGIVTINGQLFQTRTAEQFGCVCIKLSLASSRAWNEPILPLRKRYSDADGQ